MKMPNSAKETINAANEIVIDSANVAGKTTVGIRRQRVRRFIGGGM